MDELTVSRLRGERQVPDGSASALPAAAPAEMDDAGSPQRIGWRQATLPRLLWAAIVVPMAFIVAVEALATTFLERRVGHQQSHIIAATAMALVGTGFAIILFRTLARMHHSLERQKDELAALNTVARAVTGSQELTRAMTTALESVMHVMGATAGEIIVSSHEHRSGPLRIRRGDFGQLELPGRDTKDGDEPLGPPAARGLASTGPVRRCISMPLTALNEDVGFIRLVMRDEGKLEEPGSEGLLAAMGGQIGVAIRAANLFEDVLQRGEEARALYEIGLQIASVQDTQQILDSVVAHARHILGADVSALCLASPDGELTVAGLAGPPEAFMREASGIGSAPRLFTKLGADDSRLIGMTCPVLAAKYGPHHLSAPLQIGDTRIGDLCVSTLTQKTFTERERDLLESLAHMATIAINNAHLLEQERRVAVLEERSRISREMHDSLVQVLAYLHMGAEATRRTLARGDTAGAAAQVLEISSVAEEAYRDVREAILALRETISAEDGLAGAIRGYAEKFSRQSGIAITIEGDSRLLQLPGEVEVQLMRVVQEALTNIRKHAEVSTATIRLGSEGNVTTIEVEDRGKGFDARGLESSERQFGIRTMSERMERVGGKLTIASAPGEGTTVRVTIGASKGEPNGAHTRSIGR